MLPLTPAVELGRRGRGGGQVDTVASISTTPWLSGDDIDVDGHDDDK